MSNRATCSARSATARPASPSAARSAVGSWPTSPGRASWSPPARSCSASGPSDRPTAAPPEKGAVVPAEIVGLGVAVPPYVLTNADLEELVETDDQWITERTGIKERRIAGRDDSTALLGKKAATQALRVAGIDADEVDLLVVATATPDYTLPSA